MYDVLLLILMILFWVILYRILLPKTGLPV
jgi:hypothetical protein